LALDNRVRAMQAGLPEKPAAGRCGEHSKEWDLVKGSPYGIHRVLEPPGVLPQAARRIDNDMRLYDNEIRIDAEILNIDAASFTQIKQVCGGDAAKIAAMMVDIVARRGKHQNPVTGSGGMLVGMVNAIGCELEGKIDLKAGDRVATLVSLSLTPLVIHRIKAIHLDIDQVEIDGQAILFATGVYAKLPADLSPSLAVAVLDVAGAPAQTARLVNPGDTVAVIGGGGKSGLLCLHVARKRVGRSGTVIGIGSGETSCRRMAATGWADHVLRVNATDSIAVMDDVSRITDGRMADVTINCVNVPNTEMAAILATRDCGTVYFFGMATSFTAAALGAEGVGKDVTMIIGNGYAHRHADYAFELLRESPELRRLFEKTYVIAR
jgi:L-erythro-3,5-diaminohexanoate dehydrogenase